MRARVFRIDAGTAGGNITIEADELSGGYVWDTLSAMVQFDAGESHSDTGSSVSSLEPHLAFARDRTTTTACPSPCRRSSIR